VPATVITGDLTHVEDTEDSTSTAGIRTLLASFVKK
jgi:hypothetical protein